jgi:hypothetical protein
MSDTTDYSERVKKIKQITTDRYGGGRWEFRQSGYAGDINDPLWWRLDVWIGRINGHILFDLRRDFTEEAIGHKLIAMEIAMDAYSKTTAGQA